MRFQEKINVTKQRTVISFVGRKQTNKQRELCKQTPFMYFLSKREPFIINY